LIFSICSAITYSFFRKIFKLILLLFFRFKVRGGENFPLKGPFILASNHISYMDPVIVGAAAKRRVRFITSEHLYRNKFAAFLFRAVDCIEIKRGEADHKALKRVMGCLKAGKPVVIFPEGGRSEGKDMKEISDGLGFLALKTDAPVVPCLVRGSDKALPKDAGFFKSATVTVDVGEPIDPKDFDYKGSKREAYKLFTKKVAKTIMGLSKKDAS